METNDLLPILEHARSTMAWWSGVKDRATGLTRYFSGRHYTDLGNAVRFAREQGQRSVYNWNRSEELPLDAPAQETFEARAGTTEEVESWTAQMPISTASRPQKLPTTWSSAAWSSVQL